jgi:uncharacterized protein YdaU (DUF1376 family)
MSDMPWVRFFPSDWLGGTRGMSAAETGIYITLVATMYERGEPIPEDHTRLARLCGASNSTFRTALDCLIAEGKISRTEAGLWNDRVAKEQSYRSEKSEVGKQAAIARWGTKDNKNNVPGDANALPTHSRGNANQKPEPEKKGEANASPKRASARVVDLAEFKSELSDLDSERLDAIIKHRRTKRGQLTGLAARLFRKDADACGLSMPDAVDTCISRNWLTVRPDYLGSRQAAQPRSGAPPGKQTPFDALRELQRKGLVPSDEPEQLHSDFSDAQRLPAIGVGRHTGVVVDLQPGAYRRAGSGDS